MTTKTDARAVQARVLEILRREFGNAVSGAGGQIGDLDLTLKFKFRFADEATVATKLRDDFNLLAPTLGLLASDFDLPLTLNGGRACKLVEVNSRRGKYPFVVAVEGGKRFKAAADIFQLARLRALAKVA